MLFCRSPLLLTLPLLTMPLLGSCALLNPRVSPLTAFERAANGLYEGEGTNLMSRIPYRLTLTVQEGRGQASGVLTNLASHKTYTGSGTFKRSDTGGTLDMNFFENGHAYRATLRAEWQDGQLLGQVRSVVAGRELLTYNLSMKKSDAPPAPAQP